MKVYFSKALFYVVFAVAAFLMLYCPAIFAADMSAYQDYPPPHIYKISPGDKVPPFELTDLENTVWSNKTILTRPVIFITGNWKLRHDIRLWADFLAMEFNATADIIWLFNPSSTEYANQFKKCVNAFKNTRLPVPVTIDRHSIIGRSLKIEYRIPTIIGIRQDNRLAFTYASPLNDIARKEIYHLVHTRLLK